MYWVLGRHNGMKERRSQPRYSPCANPELIAEGPNQGWSWYITNLKEGITTLAYFYLSVILDILSRHVVDWMVAPRELAILVKRLIEQGCGKRRIAQDQLISHFDRGSSMTSKSVAPLLADLEITKSLSRSHVSNGNFLCGIPVQKNSEYRSRFPERFKGRMPKPTVWHFPHLPGSTNRRLPKATRRYMKFLPEVSQFYWRSPGIQIILDEAWNL